MLVCLFLGIPFKTNKQKGTLDTNTKTHAFYKLRFGEQTSHHPLYRQRQGSAHITFQTATGNRIQYLPNYGGGLGVARCQPWFFPGCKQSVYGWLMVIDSLNEMCWATHGYKLELGTICTSQRFHLSR